MEALKGNFIVDQDNQKIAVQLDIKTFTKIEEVIENYALYNLMQDDIDSQELEIDEAQQFYSGFQNNF